MGELERSGEESDYTCKSLGLFVELKRSWLLRCLRVNLRARSPSTLAQCSRSTPSWSIVYTSSTPKPPRKFPSVQEPLGPLLRVPPWTLYVQGGIDTPLTPPPQNLDHQLPHEEASGTMDSRRWMLALCFFSASAFRAGESVGTTESLKYTCKTYGSGVIQAFSNVTFYVRSNCPFTFARFTHNRVECDITIRRGKNGLINQIEIIINKVKTVVQNGTILIEKKRVSLPYDHTYQHIFQYGIYTRLRSSLLPLSVTWHTVAGGLDSVWVELEQELSSDLTGLCAIQNPAGSIQEQVRKCLIPDTTCHVQDLLPRFSLLCRQFFSHTIDCLTTKIPKYIAICDENIYTYESNSDIKCSFFKEIALLCGKKSHIWDTWRTITKCAPPNCPGDLVYIEEGSPFVPSCSNPDLRFSILENTSSCVCSADEVLNDHADEYQCVGISSCPCVFIDQIYSPGDLRTTKCQTCQCDSGRWHCSDNSCQARCMIEGQFVTTYDGKHKVKVGDEEITELYQSDVVLIFWQSSMYVDVYTALGLKLQVQVFPEIQLSITPPTEFTGLISGLCGNRNNHTTDDFTTSSGIIESSAKLFALSWSLGDCSENIPNPCINTDNEIFADENGGMTPPGPIIIDGQQCLCEDGKLHCSKDCGCRNEKVCVHCSEFAENTAQKTCDSLSKPLGANVTCESGCYCPPDQYEDHYGKCISRNNCTCMYSGQVFSAGELVKTNCKTCTCIQGQWNCIDEACSGKCQVYGNGHYQTFDSKWYRFDGHCQYTLVEDYCGYRNGSFSVRLESVPCCDEALTCSRNIILDLEDKVTLTLSDMKNNTATLSISYFAVAIEATLNNETVQPPYEKDGMRFETTGYEVFIYLPEIRSSVSLSPSFSLVVSLAMEHFVNNTQGHCGDCGGASCIRRGGQIENDTCCDKTAYDWVHHDPMKPECFSAPVNVPCYTEPTPEPTGPPPPCSPNSLCQLLEHPVFANCSKYVDMTFKKKNCEFDSCTTLNASCFSLEQAAKECKHAGFCNDWRELTNGSCDVECPEGLIYEECRDKKDDFCFGGVLKSGPNLEKTSSGCFCPPGLVRAGSHSNICVKQCTYCKGPLGEPKLPGEVWKSDCHLCTCNAQTFTEECSPKPVLPTPVCSPHTTLVNTSCCGDPICVEKTCSYHGTTYSLGDTWKDATDPCISFICTVEGIQRESRVSPTESCSEGNSIWNNENCCFTCNQTCAPKLSKINVNIDDCSTVVEVPVCEGHCLSEPGVLIHTYLQVKQRYSCCQEQGSEYKVLDVKCSDLTTRRYSYKHVTSCECRACGTH
ncbi:hypothetical protein CRENBAI_023918 [Crenichthys baileyi]|uniref:Mucin-19 n=1 Tax=Crenichthys baileyi TaxID=28760 RepID=A0AAV9SJI9_9TELE